MDYFQSEFRARKVLPDEIGRVQQLYQKMGADGHWIAKMQQEDLQKVGDFWALFCKDEMLMCLPRTTATSESLQEQTLVRAVSSVLLPKEQEYYHYWLSPAFEQKAGAYAGAFLRTLLQAEKSPVLVCVPVKSAGHLVQACFSAKLSLWAIRPLASLRPHYLFISHAQQTTQDEQIIRIADTLSISRILEEGYMGTGIMMSKGENCICFAKK